MNSGDVVRSLYVDFDGVLFDTITYAFLEMKRLGIDITNQDKITEYFKKVNWNYLIEQGGILNDSIQKLEILMDSQEFERVEVATHRCSYNEGVVKTNDLKTRIPNLKVTTIPKKIEKHYALKAQDNILIDDAKEKIINWINDGGIGILFSQKVDHLIRPYELGDNPYYITNNLLDTLLVNQIEKIKTYRKSL